MMIRMADAGGGNRSPAAAGDLSAVKPSRAASALASPRLRAPSLRKIAST